MVLLVTLGIAGVFFRYPPLQEILRWGGFVFMLYLAWKIAVADISDEKTGRSAAIV